MEGWIAKLCQNTIKYSGPEKSTGPSGVIPIAVLKEESNVEISVNVFSIYYLETYFKLFCSNI